MEPQEPRRATAYHEAAHAVMGELCGRRLTEVEIVGDEEHTGSVRWVRFAEERPAGDEEALPTAPVERRLLCTAAGMVAESMVTGRDCWDEGCAELDEAVRLAIQVVGDCERVLPYLEEVREHTAALLARHWPAVEVLAEALLERRRMTGEEVRREIAPLLRG